ncbi:hypothetical protein Daesc_004698 [Daldinia eschscholtzii]|uniref:Uncharacterized protein n=1 Tax=Daldinia eschscholtzii TaxID=292717 RepID=A0AAX6MQ33_9PEZI
MMVPVRLPSASKKEVALQAALEKLLSQRKEYAKTMASQRSKKNKVRRRSITGSSSSSIVDDSSSQNSSSKRRQLVRKETDPRHIGPQSHIKNDGGMGMNNTASSSKMVDNVTETMSTAFTPNTQMVKFKSFDSLRKIAILSVWGQERIEQDVDQNMLNAASVDAQAQSTQSLLVNAGVGQSTTSSKSTNTVNEGGMTVHNHMLRHFNSRKMLAAKFSPGAQGTLLRLSSFFGRRNNLFTTGRTRSSRPTWSKPTLISSANSILVTRLWLMS